MVDCSLKLPTLSPWQRTPPREMELVAKLKSSPQLGQVRVSFIVYFIVYGYLFTVSALALS